MATKQKVRGRITPLRQRRERDRIETMETILDCAQEVMRKKGVNGLNLPDVARMVGMQPPSLYEYYPGKNGIYDALFKRGVRLFQERIFSELSPDQNFSQCCMAIFRSFMGFTKDQPELYRLIFVHPVPGFVPSPEAVKQTEEGLQRGFKLLKAVMRHEGISPPISYNKAAFLVEIFMHGLTAHALATDPDKPLDETNYVPVINAFIKLIKG